MRYIKSRNNSGKISKLNCIWNRRIIAILELSELFAIYTYITMPTDDKKLDRA